MDFQAQYQQKLTTADEAVKVVKSGDWVDFCWCVSTPVALDQALARRSEELNGRESSRRHLAAPPCHCSMFRTLRSILAGTPAHMGGIERKADQRGLCLLYADRVIPSCPAIIAAAIPSCGCGDDSR